MCVRNPFESDHSLRGKSDHFSLLILDYFLHWNPRFSRSSQHKNRTIVEVHNEHRQLLFPQGNLITWPWPWRDTGDGCWEGWSLIEFGLKSVAGIMEMRSHSESFPHPAWKAKKISRKALQKQFGESCSSESAVYKNSEQKLTFNWEKENPFSQCCVSVVNSAARDCHLIANSWMQWEFIMWTYMMAAARGDRAATSIASRQNSRYNDDSNLSR